MATQHQQEHSSHQVQPQDNGPTVSKVYNDQRCFFFLGDTQVGKKILELFESFFYSIFITIITLITLFSDDIRVILFDSEDDLAFSIITLVCMSFFFVEMIVFSLFKEGYFNKYYFWLDLVSTLTMLFDLIWINELLTGGSGVQTAASVAKVARASRASRIGARATKLIRIIRLIRFLKLYKTASKQLAKQNQARNEQTSKRQIQVISRNSKLSVNNIERSANKRWTRIRDSQPNLANIGPKYQVSLMQLPQANSTRKIPIQNKDSIIESIQKIESLAKKQRQTQNLKELAGFQNYFYDFHKSGTKGQPSMENIGMETQSQIDVPEETKVGTKLKDQIQKNLISMILLIIISVPLFNASTWYDNITVYEKGIQQLEDLAQISSAAYEADVDFYVQQMMNYPSKLVYFQLNVNSSCCTFPDNYTSYQVAYGVSTTQEYRNQDLTAYQTAAGSVVVFESSSQAILAAQLNIGRTLFVCIVLIIATLMFSRDVEIYALEPLENMIQTVKKIALNPLGAIRQIEQKKMTIQAVEENYNYQKDEQQQTQPNMLENLIVKIGGLLAVGFGQAGTQIICRVIEDPNFVDVIIPGQKVMGIYGFCDIRNFTDATEILQADVMVFVNEIAQICHKVVNAHGGSPNKNIGDAFLLVWKYQQGDMKFQNQNTSKNLQLAETKRVKQIADLAVLSFVRMIAEITKSYALLKYKNNKALKNRIKDYKGVKMGFGLHVGWSIQGPIGSQYKVDASYLSPSVNMASRLQGATKEYGVPMLITGGVYNLMTENKRFLRQVDRVLFDGYDQPTDLYTVDLHIDSLANNRKIQKGQQLSVRDKKYSKVKENIKRNKLLENIETKYITKDMWNHNDIRIMRQRYSKGFYDEWNKGFKSYIDGEWKQALEMFKRTQIMAPDQVDGPSATLIQYIESYNCQAPQNWKGYREVSF